MIPQCIDQGVGVIPWSPLARGLLAGNRTREGERLTTRARSDAFGDSLYKLAVWPSSVGWSRAANRIRELVGALQLSARASGCRRRARSDAFGDSLYKPEVDFAVVDRAAELAGERGCSTAQIALSWLLHKPGVTAPIVGATRLEHREVALAAERRELAIRERALEYLLLAADRRAGGQGRRRCHQARAPRGRAGGRAARVERGRDRTPRGAVRPARDRRPLTVSNRRRHRSRPVGPRRPTGARRR